MNKQVQIYSFETNALYTNDEYEIDLELNELRRNSILISKEIDIINQYKNGKINKDIAIKRICKVSKSYEKSSSVNEYHFLTEKEKIKNILNGVRNKKSMSSHLIY